VDKEDRWRTDNLTCYAGPRRGQQMEMVDKWIDRLTSYTGRGKKRSADEEDC